MSNYTQYTFVGDGKIIQDEEGYQYLKNKTAAEATYLACRIKHRWGWVIIYWKTNVPTNQALQAKLDPQIP